MHGMMSIQMQKQLLNRPRVLRCTHVAYLVNSKACGVCSNRCAMNSYIRSEFLVGSFCNIMMLTIIYIQ
jgi:hypothetical protein